MTENTNLPPLDATAPETETPEPAEAPKAKAKKKAAPKAEPKPDPYAGAFGAMLKDARERRQMSQAEFCSQYAALTGTKLTQQMLSSIENGTRSASISRAAEFCLVLDIPLAAIVTNLGVVSDRMLLVLPSAMATELAPLQELPADSDINTYAAKLVARFARMDAGSEILRAFVNTMVDQFDAMEHNAEDAVLRVGLAAAASMHVLSSGQFPLRMVYQPAAAAPMNPVVTTPDMPMGVAPVQQDADLPPGWRRQPDGSVVADLGAEQAARGHDAAPDTWERNEEGIPTTTVAVTPE